MPTRCQCTRDTPSDAGAGILLMIASHVCKPSEFRWQEVAPGRILHAQLRFSQRCFDLVACYQHTFMTGKARLHDRQLWWRCLDKYLSTLPKRNVLLLAGDFNCSLPTVPGHVGSDGFRLNRSQHFGSAHPDIGDFVARGESASFGGSELMAPCRRTHLSWFEWLFTY